MQQTLVSSLQPSLLDEDVSDGGELAVWGSGSDEPSLLSLCITCDSLGDDKKDKKLDVYKELHCGKTGNQDQCSPWEDAETTVNGDLGSTPGYE